MLSYNPLKSTLCIAIVYLFGLSQAFPVKAQEKVSITPRIKSFVESSLTKGKKPPTIGVSIAELNGGDVYSKNASTLMKPASVLKVATSYTALKMLKASYRFPTEFFVDRMPYGSSDNGSVGNLYVRGYGDPSLLDEHLWRVSQILKEFGVKRIQSVVIDDSLFIDPQSPTGERTYQAGLSATALNHNCYSVTVTPQQLGDKALVSVDQGFHGKLTTNVKTTQGKGIKLGVTQIPSSLDSKMQWYDFQKFSRAQPFSVLHTLNISGSIGARAEPQTMYFSSPYPFLYFGNTFTKILVQSGIEVGAEATRGETPSTAKKLYQHQSKPLSFIVNDLNHYSNNFIAGQILYALGQDEVGVFRKEVAFKRIAESLDELGIAEGSYEMYDGSGLDHNNRMSAEQVMKILLAGYRDFSIQPDFISSLSRFGVSGTLKKRILTGKHLNSNRAQRNVEGVWAKTGTLNGVSSLAGYVEGASGRRYAFVILLNNIVSKSHALAIENGIVELLLGS